MRQHRTYPRIGYTTYSFEAHKHFVHSRPDVTGKFSFTGEANLNLIVGARQRKFSTCLSESVERRHVAASQGEGFGVIVCAAPAVGIVVFDVLAERIPAGWIFKTPIKRTKKSLPSLLQDVEQAC